MFVVGEIVNTHGLKGEVKVKRVTDFSERFHVGEKVYITLDSVEVELIIDQFRTQKNLDVLHFEGHNSINDVEHFKGHSLYIKEEQLTPLDEHEYYYYEIIGCKVVTTENEPIGTIASILTPGANDVWVVENDNGKEILIPYIEQVVKHVDVDRKLITIEIMEGLLE